MNEDVLVIGAGPAGLLAAWTCRQRGARVKVVASGIGTTHIMPGWLQVLKADGSSVAEAVRQFATLHPGHPYALAGTDTMLAGLAMLGQVLAPAGWRYSGSIDTNMRLPTIMGAIHEAAFAPESFVAGDLRESGSILIAGPDGWRDFYPHLCAENLTRQGYAARGLAFPLPEMESGRFDVTPPGLARLFEQPEIRQRVAHLIRSRLEGCKRVGFPAILGLESHAEVWNDLQDRLGVPVFEMPTLPPSVPGIRVFQAFKRALSGAGVQLLLDMTATRANVEGRHISGIVIPTVTGRQAEYRAGRYILATGGLFGGGIASDHRGALRELVLDLFVESPGERSEWFQTVFLGEQPHSIHGAGVRANRAMQPVDVEGHVVYENIHIAGRLLAGSQPLAEGSTEGVWLGTAYRAAVAATSE